MKLKKFKEKDNKRIGIIVFTLVCILLVSGVILYRTFAIFEVKTSQNVIKGTVQDPGNIYFAFYQKNEETGDYEIQKEMPAQGDGYVLDEEASYCGVTGVDDSKIKVSLTEDWVVHVSGITTSRTKCNLYFTKGIFLMGHGVPVVEEGDGLYKVEHDDSSLEDGWKKEEYRYVGGNVKNYMSFNDETWRIIGLVNVLINENKIEQRVKVTRGKSIGNFAWDIHREGEGNWTSSTLMQMLNGMYYESTAGTCWTGVNNKTITETTCDFSNLGLHEKARAMIDDNVIWNIGGTNIDANSDAFANLTITDFYDFERGNVTTNGFPAIWNIENTTGITFHSIGLLYPSDYKYGKGELANWISSLDSGWQWTLTPLAIDYAMTLYVQPNLAPYCHVRNVPTPLAVLPTLYLKPTVKIISGTGSSDDAFEIAQVIK